MTMRDFIKENRSELDRAIKQRLNNPTYNARLNDAERRAWIENDESLYNWARMAGVPV